LKQRASVVPGPQIVAWSDPNDLCRGRFRRSKASTS
jgi:hypothetical protein